MAGVPQKLFDPVQLSGNAAYGQIGTYSVPTGKLIDGLEILLVNTTQAERTVSLRLGSSSAARYQLYNEMVLPAGDVVPRSLRQVLGAGNKIYARASADNAITAHVSGLEEDASGSVSKRLWAANFLQTSVGNFYTVPASKKLINIELIFCHTGAAGSGNREVNLYLTPSGGVSGLDSSAGGRRLSMPPKDTVRMSLRQVLNAGDKIQIGGDVADVVSAHGSGYLIDA